MTIERLQELKDMIKQDYMTEDLYSGRDVISEDGEDLISLIDEKISHLSVPDEDVQDAIEQCEYALEDEQLESDGEWSCATFSTTAIITMLTALQQMQKEPISIAKPPILKYVCTYLCPRDVPDGDDEYGYEPHCANCGKRFERFPRINFCSECGQKQNWEEIEKQISEES